SGITEELTDRCSGHWCIYLHWGWVRCIGSYNHCISHSSFIFQCLNDLSYRRTFLTYSNVDTVNTLTRIVKLFLVQHGVNGNSSLTSLTVTNDKFPLTSSDWNHGVNSHDTCLQRLVYRLSEDYPRCFSFQRHFIKVTGNWSFTVYWVTKSVYYPTQHSFTYINR